MSFSWLIGRNGTVRNSMHVTAICTTISPIRCVPIFLVLVGKYCAYYTINFVTSDLTTRLAMSRIRTRDVYSVYTHIDRQWCVRGCDEGGDRKALNLQSLGQQLGLFQRMDVLPGSTIGDFGNFEVLGKCRITSTT